MTTRTDDKTYVDKITKMKRERIYREIVPILNELRQRIDELEADLEDHKAPKSRGRPKKNSKVLNQNEG